MEISSLTADKIHGYNGSDEQVAEIRLSLDSDNRWNLLNSFPAFLLNLEREDSKLIPDGEFDFVWFQSNFPSPSFRSSFNFEVKLAAIEDADVESRDGPLFWPLEHEIEWKSMEDWNWFAISPRKKDLKSSAVPLNSNNGLRLHGRKITLNQVPKRRFVFNSRSVASEMMELKERRDSKACVPRIGAVPSRFNRPGNRNSAGKGWVDEKLIAMDRDFEEKDMAAREEIPIETLLGLREFDGREGLGSELDEVVLSLDEDEVRN
ncbi:uncharacterized protein E5676_scaffold130G001380 [Cucumis melo var. makuwa]|uniref:Uncharacterized protein LOC107991266 n=2 Tax=Cucumis melo TaxID=3656 RepID=A0A1S4DZS4_CUCME|nr:uncharacterized protein LOC107991266 [Cucumis melo]TYK16996.1 uncharacterized protein E5676_scaffold130G001380 [Cucumis melo var. makuwa]